MPMNRVIWMVLDGVGAGALPDAKNFGDEGSNTLTNLANQRPLELPTLAEMGIGNITPIQGTPPCASGQGRGAFGKAQEKSCGKDTSTGHWEMAGLEIAVPFKTFPNGFEQKHVDRWIKENNLSGVLGNKPASGTEIIKDLGEEHVRTQKPILYTSADSVWQVAAHEEHFGLERLYEICHSARKICDELQICRVIARPFIGDSAETFQRTYNRKDLAQPPPNPTYLDHLVENGIPTRGIGKISAIFAGHGIQDNIDTKGNTDGLLQTKNQLKEFKKGLLFCNLIDTDMLYGHRRDVPGYAKALEEIDSGIASIIEDMDSDDLLVLASDHGNDPTFKGTDHTREYIPVLCYSKRQPNGPIDLGTLKNFGDVGATITHALTGKEPRADHWIGQSFYSKLGIPA